MYFYMSTHTDLAILPKVSRWPVMNKTKIELKHKEEVIDKTKMLLKDMKGVMDKIKILMKDKKGVAYGVHGKDL